MADEKPDDSKLFGVSISGWTTLVGAIFLGVTQIVQMILTYNRDIVAIEHNKAIAAKVEAVAGKQEEVVEASKQATTAVEAVKSTIQVNAQARDEKLEAFGAQLEDVHKLTTEIKDSKPPAK